MKLTLFAIPKAFQGRNQIIQTNAISSWKLLQPPPEIILFGDEEGTAEIAREFGVRHVPAVGHNELGTPLVNDLFNQAQRLATHEILCYVNADIILMGDFLQALTIIKDHMDRFLMAGQRRNLDISEPLDFRINWQERLELRVAHEGQEDITGIDYFAFPRGLFTDIPPFAIGRTVWDGWLLYSARARKIPLVDASKEIMVVHQNHDYHHIKNRKLGTWKGPEALRNQGLAGGYDFFFNLHDANWVLTGNGLIPARTLEHRRRARQTWLLLHCPRLHRCWKAFRRACSSMLGLLPVPLLDRVRRLYASMISK